MHDSRFTVPRLFPPPSPISDPSVRPESVATGIGIHISTCVQREREEEVGSVVAKKDNARED